MAAPALTNHQYLSEKSYASVKDTYPGIEVRKLECIGHFQKRVGSRWCRELKKKNTGRLAV